MKVRIKDLLGRSLRLRALPKIVYQLQTLLESGGATSASIAHTLRNDPALSVQVLRIANSSWYQNSSRIDTISRAVTVIGHVAINNLVLASSIVSVFPQNKMPSFDLQKHWAHSVQVAILARMMAEQCHVLLTEPFFIAGLLHDIGAMVIAMRLPDISHTLYMRFPGEVTPTHEIEQKVLGFTHADVGAELLAAWSLPEHLIDAVRFHHTPEQAEQPSLGAAIIQIASAYVQPNDQDQGHLAHLIDASSWQATGLNKTQMPALMTELKDSFASTFDAFFSQAA